VPVTPELLHFSVRPATDRDLPFIYDAWKRSYRAAIAHTLRGRRAQAFLNLIQRRIDTMMTLPDAAVVVAVHADDENALIGFAAGSLDVLHYVYVKAPYRRQGVAMELIRTIYGQDAGVLRPVLCAYWTPAAQTAAVRAAAYDVADPVHFRYIGLDSPEDF
jgi:GNAT superfamily N-acetyltransferase